MAVGIDLLEILSLLRSSTIVVDELSSHGRVSLGDRELVPSKAEYHSSRSVVILWTRKSSWEIGSLYLLAAEPMSLSQWSYDSWRR